MRVEVAEHRGVDPFRLYLIEQPHHAPFTRRQKSVRRHGHLWRDIDDGDAWSGAGAEGEGEEAAAAARFMRGHRVNVTVRQCCA